MRRSKFYSQKGKASSGVEYESGLEKRFLEQMYMLGVRVQRSKLRIPYTGEDGRTHHYLPDFYLPELDFTVEIKGVWAFRTNHASVKEKFFAATKALNGRYTLLTERELRSPDFVARLMKELRDAKTA